MNTDDSRRARRLGLAVGAAAGAAIILAAASPAAAATRAGWRSTHKPSASVVDDTLTIRGTKGNDKITLRPVDANTLQVDFGGGVVRNFQRNTFTMIDVRLRDGDDKFRVDPPTALLGVEEMTINGGNGNDRLKGGADAEHFIGGRGNDFVDGNGGSDTADLGSGWDTFRWDPGDGSDLIDGGTGTDKLDFRGNNAAEIMKLRAVGELSQFTRNLGNIVMDMNRVERLNLVAGGGEDRITINDMSGTGFRRADVNLTSVDAKFNPVGGPDGAADTVIVNGTNKADHIDVTARDTRVDVEGLQPKTRLTNTETLDTLKINTLKGDDDVDVDPAVRALIGVQVNLDGGQH